MKMRIPLFIILLFITVSGFSFHASNIKDGGAKTDFILATINIRYPTKKDSVNYWEYRKKQMIDFVNDANLDIVCFQEVSLSQLNYLEESLTDYSFAGNKIRKVKGEGYKPILYRKKVFTCLDEGTFWLSETPDSVGSKGWDGKHSRRATWAKLKSRKTGKSFCVVNTHLDNVGKVARQKGMELIKRRLKSTSDSIPVVLCGDMNCSSSSTTYRSALNDEFMMNDAYQVAKVRKGVSYSFHRFGKNPVEKRGMIDFIFVTNQFEVKYIYIPKEEKRNGSYLTDHCPVVTNLCF